MHPPWILVWRRFGRGSRRSKVNSRLWDLIQNPWETSIILGETIVYISPSIKNTEGLQLYMRALEGKLLNFTSNNEKPYNTPFSVDKFHQAATRANETSSGYDWIIKNNRLTL